jgi:hypothetical protein
MKQPVSANQVVTTGWGRNVTAAAACDIIPARAWRRMRTGSGAKGTRRYDLVMLKVTSDDTPDGHEDGIACCWVRQRRYTRSAVVLPCWTPGPVRLSQLIAVGTARWRVEIVFPQLAKGQCGPSGRSEVRSGSRPSRR